MDIKITKGQSIIVNEKPYGCSVMETKRGFTWVPNSTSRDQGLTCLTSNSMSGLLTIASFYGKMCSQLEDLPDQLTLKSSVIYSLIKHSGSLAYLPMTPKPSSRELIDLPLIQLQEIQGSSLKLPRLHTYFHKTRVSQSVPINASLSSFVIKTACQGFVQLVQLDLLLQSSLLSLDDYLLSLLLILKYSPFPSKLHFQNF